MLHITLTILKIIGIILLVLILLVIAVLFALLFVPLRYRIQAVYTNDKVRGELRLTWLLHLISVRLALAEDTSYAEKGVTDTIGVDTEDTDIETETSSGSAGQLFSRFAHIQPYSEARILGIRLESLLAFFGKIRSIKSNHGASGNSAGRGAARRRTQNKQPQKRQTQKKQTPGKTTPEQPISKKQIARTQTQERHTTDNRPESLSDAQVNGKKQAESSDGAMIHED
ncbi:MAG: hypothetical protein LUF30_11185 [Lachnospiraceae bacterium]|nr:hypothetical protein [Lachnospiraceae bacterium]